MVIIMDIVKCESIDLILMDLQHLMRGVLIKMNIIVLMILLITMVVKLMQIVEPYLDNEVKLSIIIMQCMASNMDRTGVFIMIVLNQRVDLDVVVVGVYKLWQFKK